MNRDRARISGAFIRGMANGLSESSVEDLRRKQEGREGNETNNTMESEDSRNNGRNAERIAENLRRQQVDFARSIR